MSDKLTNTENAARVASDGEEHRNSVQGAECEERGYGTAHYERPITEEEAKRILKTPASSIWTKHLLSSI